MHVLPRKGAQVDTVRASAHHARLHFQGRRNPRRLGHARRRGSAPAAGRLRQAIGNADDGHEQRHRDGIAGVPRAHPARPGARGRDGPAPEEWHSGRVHLLPRSQSDARRGPAVHLVLRVVLRRRRRDAHRLLDHKGNRRPDALLRRAVAGHYERKLSDVAPRPDQRHGGAEAKRQDAERKQAAPHPGGRHKSGEERQQHVQDHHKPRRPQSHLPRLRRQERARQRVAAVPKPHGRPSKGPPGGRVAQAQAVGRRERARTERGFKSGPDRARVERSEPSALYGQRRRVLCQRAHVRAVPRWKARAVPRPAAAVVGLLQRRRRARPARILQETEDALGLHQGRDAEHLSRALSDGCRRGFGSRRRAAADALRSRQGQAQQCDLDGGQAFRREAQDVCGAARRDRDALHPAGAAPAVDGGQEPRERADDAHAGHARHDRRGAPATRPAVVRSERRAEFRSGLRVGAAPDSEGSLDSNPPSQRRRRGVE